VSALPGIRAELAASVRRVNSLYSRIPENRRPDVDGSRWRELEAELHECFAAGDRDGALRAIERWERHARAVLAPPGRWEGPGWLVSSTPRSPGWR
jgi:hypothetical protein